jgi:hypothetical protein
LAVATACMRIHILALYTWLRTSIVVY